MEPLAALKYGNGSTEEQTYQGWKAETGEGGVSNFTRLYSGVCAW